MDRYYVRLKGLKWVVIDGNNGNYVSINNFRWQACVVCSKLNKNNSLLASPVLPSQ